MLPGTQLSLEFEMEPEGQSLDPTAGANAFASLSPLDRYCPSSHRETRRGELPRTMPVLFEKLTNNTLRGRVARADPRGNSERAILPPARELWRGRLRLSLAPV